MLGRRLHRMAERKLVGILVLAQGEPPNALASAGDAAGTGLAPSASLSGCQRSGPSIQRRLLGALSFQSLRLRKGD